MTLVNAIKQIVETQASCKILVCAPTNSATDHLFEKLLEKFKNKFEEYQAYRLYALSASLTNIPQKIEVWILSFFFLTHFLKKHIKALACETTQIFGKKSHMPGFLTRVVYEDPEMHTST